ncbi:MAG: hypothetical protein COA74_12315 [Gammaproteobacteria bacterium]|nr:MAG: hypothetical protein COA74_12315 [Gammaproteobacteria bacterium]
MKNLLKITIEKNCHFTRAGLQDEVIDQIHPNSLSYAQSKQMLKQLFANYQLDVSLKEFKYMGKDKIYAYAKVQQKTLKISGPEFKNNITEQLIVFKQDGDDWKIWTTAILNIKYLE